MVKMCIFHFSESQSKLENEVLIYFNLAKIFQKGTKYAACLLDRLEYVISEIHLRQKMF